MSRPFHALLGVVSVLGLTGLYAEEPKAKPPAYELHEWGVFTVPRSAAWANLDLRQEWSTFPVFFNRIWPDRRLPNQTPPDHVRKPVIWIHAEGHIPNLSLTVRFTDGRPLVWWPPATYPTDSLPFNKEPNRLTFTLNAGLPEGTKEKAHPAVVPKGHWMEALRAVKSTRLYTDDGAAKGPGRWSVIGHTIAEHFVYYDGMLKGSAAPKVSRDNKAVVLDTDSSHAWLDVLVLEKQAQAAAPRVAWVNEIAKGARQTKVEPAQAELGLVRAELVKRLNAAGLNDDEAQALVKVWDEGIFGRDGLHVLYRIPQETYAAWLPLECKPAPMKSVRVGLIFHEHLEPELDARVEQLIKQLGSEQFNVREEAQKELLKIGGAAFPVLERAAKSEEAEASKAARAILETLDVRPALELNVPAK